MIRLLITFMLITGLLTGCDKLNSITNGSPPKKVFSGWTEVTVTGSPKTGLIHILYDPSSIKREGDIAQVWELDNFEQPQTNALGNYLSAKVLKEYNCKTNELRLVSFSSFSENDGKGNIVNSSSDVPNWDRKMIPIEPNSMATLFPPIVCK